MIRNVTTELLENLGYRVVIASSGREAWDVALLTSPDIAVLDALMPGYDGRELCRLMKAHPQTKHIKIIVMTGLYRSLTHKQEAFSKFGVDDYLPKPCNADTLQSSITRQLSQ